jgi:hypothetical protein
MNYHEIFEFIGQLVLIYLVVQIIRRLITKCEISYFTEQEDPYLLQLKEELSVLDPKLKDIKMYVGEKSYTINKKKIYICMKDENGEYYQRNMLAYCIIHEFAHVLCIEIGHTELFFEIFQGLLKQAAQQGLYDPTIPLLTDYCGHT